MEQHEKLVNTIRDLVENQILIGTEGETREVLIKDTHLRAKILADFGLPNKSKNRRILVTESKDVEKEVETISNNLIQALFKWRLHVLESAIERELAPHGILETLKIPPHLYMLYVYREILLKKRDSPTAVLEALYLANDRDTLSKLATVALSENFGKEEQEILEQLRAKGIKYLDEYVSAYQFEGKKEELHLSSLSEFWYELNDGFQFKTLEDKFDSLAYYLMNYLYLAVSDQLYRITELEIYYHDKENHPDPYVHCSEEQLSAGNWYFNGMGLDITFGNKEKEIYGGILIRGIMKFGEKPKYINGPSNVLKEIFSNIGNILSERSQIYIGEIEKEVAESIEMEPIKSVRIGLTKKNDDTENYAEKNYRYLVDINLQHKKQ